MRRLPFTAGWSIRPRANPFAEMVGAGPAWEPVTLPHDATIGGQRHPGHGGAAGFLPGGTFEYRTTLDAPEEWRDRRVLLEFEGVYRSAMVYVNGSLAGQWASGYSGFTVPLDDVLRYGAANEVRVECRSHADSRWYAGAGIHRPVHLLVGPLCHIAPHGVQVTTPDVDEELAVVHVATTVENHGRGLRTLTVTSRLRDGQGTVVATDEVPVSVLPGQPAVVRQRMAVTSPALWGPGSPALHTAEVTLGDPRQGSEVLDEETVTFGIRTVQVDPVRGLRINGRPVLLRGACVHSDNGVLGAAAIGRADERRVELLQAAGFNALRSAHNPMSTAMLEACDRLGVMVMDELTDVWTQAKTDFDAALTFGQWWERDLEAMVAKDVNHPSVIMYSTGNEIPEVATPHGAVWARRIAERVRQLDPTRLVTNGVNGPLSVPFDLPTELTGAGINTLLATIGDVMREFAASDEVGAATAEAFGVLDVAGFNYMESRYTADRTAFPNRVVVGSETAPNQVDRLWRLVQDNPQVLGDFTWTGWDYLGEAGIGRVSEAGTPEAASLAGPWPWLTAWCGDIDITGRRRPASYYREIVFGLRTDPYIAVHRPERHGQEVVSTPWSWTDSVSSWSWPDQYSGRPITVEVYSDAEEVELQLDGVPIGTSPAGEANRFRAVFETVYLAGELTALSRSGGEVVGRHTVRTATGALRLQLTPDRDTVRADDRDLSHVAVALVDAAGTTPVGDNRAVTVTVEGPAVLQGLGSGVPVTEESLVDAVHTTSDGHLLAVVRPTGAGAITVTATAPGCEPVTVRLHAR